MVNIDCFSLSRLPHIEFGIGKFNNLAVLTASMGRRVLLAVSRTFKGSENYDTLIKEMQNVGIDYFEMTVSGEPSPQIIDAAVKNYKQENIDVVVSIGGGSVIDAGKAISAMLCEEGSIADYLEGVGTKKPSGKKVSFIAVPTSSGTGSEATKNAVISSIGERGFKKSLRHDNYVPDAAVVDPMLTVSLPPSVTAACGLDALTQLIESYTSKNASPITDALAESGLRYVKEGFIRAFADGNDIEARSSMSYAALISGITLANAGLGVVHGLASPIGGFYEIPHGVVCGTLLGSATRMNIETLLKDADKHKACIEKYSNAGIILSGKNSGNIENNCYQLIKTLEDWIERTEIPRLDKYGICTDEINKIVEKASYKFNPADLSKDQVEELLVSRI